MLFVAFYTLSSNHWLPDSAVGFSTIVLLWGVGKIGKLTTWLGHSIFRYLGKISYSLYLIHFPVIATILAYGHSRTGGTGNEISLVWFPVAAAASFVAAHLLYVAVERPSMRLASSLKRPLSLNDGAAPAVPTVATT
jgi:peptidoglycan/LPS O-acetylase OafA/YrhL